ncbi:MAG TPA: FAD-binding oxidoreductase [Natrialbaceae archaeon]|nr:FAD-binding oxidoreductase [Natrialbaceae archaeon]
MAIVDEHDTLRERAEKVPLITQKARTIDIRALDEVRTDDVRCAMAEFLVEHGRGDLVEDGDPCAVDWEAVEALPNDVTDDFGSKFHRLLGRYQREHPALVSVELRPLEEDVAFVPGQFISVKFCGTPRAYSVASSPNHDLLRFCIRRVPGGRLTPRLCDGLCPGEQVTIRGPNGDFVLSEPSERDVAFLATGTGAAPFRSMIDYIFEEGRDVYAGEKRDVWLFLGASWRDDLPFHEHFQSLDEEHDNFHYVPTCSREHYLTDWDGESAYVQQTLLKYMTDDVDGDGLGDMAAFLDEKPDRDIDARIDPSNLQVYSCGLNMMVNTVEETATQVGVDPRYIDVEGYG